MVANLKPAFEIDPVTPAIGAEVRNVDLSQPLPPTVLDQLYDALMNHLVLFFHDQDLTPQAQLDLASSFGPIVEPHPVYPHVPGFDQVTMFENDANHPPDTDDWHTDLTFQPEPPFVSVLHAIDVPESGGDTLWASMYAAYDALPADMKSLVADLKAVHDMGTFRNSYLGENSDVGALNEGMAKVGSAVHDIAPVHPVTQKRLLFVNRSFTRLVVGVVQTESDRILQYLLNHIDSPNFQVRFRWKKGSVAIWDNRTTQHFAVADYLPNYRRMHRVVVAADRRLSLR